MPKKNAQPAIEAVTPIVTGYRIRPKYRDIVCDWEDIEEGEEPLRATIRTNLSFDEIDALPALLGTKYTDLWAAMAPHVTTWNLTAVNELTGNLEAVPPPAEAGPDVFRAADALVTQWLFIKVKTAHLGDDATAADRKNDSSPSESGPDAVSSNDSDET